MAEKHVKREGTNLSFLRVHVAEAEKGTQTIMELGGPTITVVNEDGSWHQLEYAKINDFKKIATLSGISAIQYLHDRYYLPALS